MRTPTCAVCEDQGWVLVDIYGSTAGPTVVCCLCLEGEKRKAGQLQIKRTAKTLADVWCPDEIAEKFPAGTATAAAAVARERLAAVGLAPVCREWTLQTYRDVVVAGDRELTRYATWGTTWSEQAAPDRGDVVIYGNKGTGKTGLAVAMLRAAFDRNEAVRFITARDLMLAFRESMRDDGDGERAIDERFQAPQVLVLDEFGGTSLTDYQRNTLTSLIDARAKAQRSTILTLNVDDTMHADADVQTQMRDVLGGRLVDRLTETAQWWALIGKSRRKPRTRVRRQEVGARG